MFYVNIEISFKCDYLKKKWIKKVIISHYVKTNYVLFFLKGDGAWNFTHFKKNKQNKCFKSYSSFFYYYNIFLHEYKFPFELNRSLHSDYT